MQKKIILICVVIALFIVCYESFSLSEGLSTISVESMDGLKLEFVRERGVISSFTTSGVRLEDPDSISTSGFFVRDLKTERKPLPLSGAIKSDGRELEYSSTDNKLGLQVQARFIGNGKRIDMDIDVTDLTDTDRILTLYFALPLNLDGWIWGDDIRNSRPIKGNKIISNTVAIRFGSNEKMSRYPFAAIWKEDGIAIGYPLDHPAVIRMAADPNKKQLYISYDFALSRNTKTPCKTRLRAVIFRFDPEWGFRAATKKYYEIYPDFFKKRVKKEGIWVFRPRYLNKIPQVDDFGIAFHTVSFYPWSLKFEDNNGIYSLQYLTEAWTHYMDISSTLRNGDYNKVIDYMKYESNKGNQKAEAVLSSGIFDHNNRYLFWINGPKVKWCPDCVIFTLNADPDIQDKEYPLNKAYFEWYDNNAQIYSKDPSKGILDGEMIDSFEVMADVLDYRDSHIAAADLPLTYSRKILRPAVPEVFASYEFSRWIRDKVLALGKLTMANGVLQRFSFPAHLFDIMGIEVGLNIIHLDKDESFNFWRTMSYQKPYCLLYHDELNERFTSTFIEKYFQASLFYGMYPGFFGNNGASIIYFKEPRLYERDRDLFKKYLPLIKKLGKAGWEPVTHVRSTNSKVFVERFGEGTSLYITVRNSSENTSEYELRIEADKLDIKLREDERITFMDMISGDRIDAAFAGSIIRLKDRFEAGRIRMFHPSTPSVRQLLK